MRLTTDQLVRREVLVCVSYLMADLSTLFWGYHGRREEYARKTENPFDEETIIELFREVECDGESYEVFEHWAVTPWLARKLREHGEKVLEVSNLLVWCRTTTGQQISADDVMQKICDEVNS